VQAQRGRAEAFAAKHASQLRFVVWDLAPVHHMDGHGVQLLRELQRGLRAQGGRLVLAAPAPRVAALLEASGLASELGEEWVFGSAAAAEGRCRALLAAAPPAAPRRFKLVADARAAPASGALRC
jgi:ABC-type transporter Mla MlaB component